ncbi:MAG: pectin esterase, partial [Bacteroidales bacterium]|nr:pectin esterase [Bacteroidales bacterium]
MKKLILLVLVAVSATFAFAQNYDLVVAKDGSGDFDNIQDAINAIRDYKPEGRQRILVRKGVYEEKVIVPSYKTNISLIGENRDSTIIIWHDHANMRTKSGWPAFSLSDERNAQSAIPNKNLRKIGTFQTYTLRVDGPGFECENMTISNDAMTFWNRSWKQDRNNRSEVAQAVAVHVEGDRAVFRNCRLLGFQDTLFTGNDDSRQVYYNCYIEGTVDFIFGPATCWFEGCELHAITNGYLTAASTPGTHPYGYVFYRCKVTADPAVTSEWLGRPWRNDASVVFRECELPAVINP